MEENTEQGSPGGTIVNGPDGKKGTMRRVQAFEFNERPETPGFIRDAITEVLGMVWRVIRVVNPVGPAFAEFCRNAGCLRVLDLASGSGEPASILMDGLQREGDSTVRLVLSDLYPKVGPMERVAARYSGRIEVVRFPVDAADVPGEIACDACSIVGAFHHFPPDLAVRILADCVKKRRAVFILDVPPQTVRRFLLLFPLPGVLALLLNPLVTREARLSKALFTYLVPAIPLLGTWDFFVSALRFYSEDEYREMARQAGGEYRWEYREIPFFPGGRLGVFSGIPELS